MADASDFPFSGLLPVSRESISIRINLAEIRYVAADAGTMAISLNRGDQFLDNQMAAAIAAHIYSEANIVFSVSLPISRQTDNEASCL